MSPETLTLSPRVQPAGPAEWAPAPARLRPGQHDPWAVRWSLTLLAVALLVVLVVVPVVNVFAQALAHGVGVYWNNLVASPETRHAIMLTLTVAPLAVALNLVFGVAAAWAIARFRFPGRTLLTTLIDLPFSVSPVVAGLVFVLLFGLQGYFGPWLHEHGVRIIFAWPGLVLATTFVTFPFVARELIPVLEALGPDEELAALSLGARPWQIFWWVTLPNVKWGLLYGVILCNARAMGEFGAVYVVSGRIGGRTDTMPLRVEKLFQEYNTPAAFAVASVLTLLALVTLVLKAGLERKAHAPQAEMARAAKEAVST
jgi:sulfate transport system permease protein